MLIDTHCHLNFKDFDIDRDKIINQCLNPAAAGQVWMINVGVDYKTSKEVIELAEKYDKGVYASVALHPHNVKPDKSFAFRRVDFLALAKKSKVVAIGETGLDYMFCEDDEKTQELQKKVFIQHLELAKQLKKPVIIHSRRLFPEILEIVKKHKVRGILHCYMGRWSYAEEYLKLGFYIGFTGLIVYARDYDKVIKNTPLERILIETDAPYLSPTRGKRSTPLDVEKVAHKIAEIKGVSFDKVAKQTTKNAKELFGLKQASELLT